MDGNIFNSQGVKVAVVSGRLLILWQISARENYEEARRHSPLMAPDW